MSIIMVMTSTPKDFSVWGRQSMDCLNNVKTTGYSLMTVFPGINTPAFVSYWEPLTWYLYEADIYTGQSFIEILENPD